MGVTGLAAGNIPLPSVEQPGAPAVAPRFADEELAHAQDVDGSTEIGP